MTDNPSRMGNPILENAPNNKLEFCAHCGERHTAKAIAFAKLIGASSVLCRKCTGIEKAKRGISYG